VSPLLRELILECTRRKHDESAEHPAGVRLRGVLLDQLSSAERLAEHLPAPTSPLLRAVCEGMAADPADARTLADWAREVVAGERTLSRLFRAELGLTFPQWRTRLRLHHALVLLSDGLPVTTVAHRCGWASASAFIDVFRRTFGYTPGSRPTPQG
jgi:transcriptional regulator GlxA family with amidase domain